jgi:tRNA-Thr(GGU) m(6)t(6)A37 methyltransferase TsaA
MSPVAVIRTSFGEKFGVPRQPGLAPSAKGRIVFENPYRNPDTLRGIEGFSHLWVIFAFHLAEGWSPTVRPPRLGGNERVGVFASRSPFRPNPIGLSVVKLERVELDSPEGPVLHVSGVDLVDGTPVLDIKPYVAYSDALPEARSGFAGAPPEALLSVEFAPGLRERLESESPGLAVLIGEVLAADPRPAFHDDPIREYGVLLEGRNVRFRVSGTTCTVISADK